MSVWVQGMMQAQQTRASDKALTHTHSCPASAQCTAFVTAACSEDAEDALFVIASSFP